MVLLIDLLIYSSYTAANRQCWQMSIKQVSSCSRSCYSNYKLSFPQEPLLQLVMFLRNQHAKCPEDVGKVTALSSPDRYNVPTVETPSINANTIWAIRIQSSTVLWYKVSNNCLINKSKFMRAVMNSCCLLLNDRFYVPGSVRVVLTKHSHWFYNNYFLHRLGSSGTENWILFLF